VNALLSPRLRALRRFARVPIRATYATPRPLLTWREELPLLLDRRRLLGVGFEIGVREAAFSAWLLERWHGRLLVSVDPWREAPAEEYVDEANVPQVRQDALHAEAQARLARFGARSRIWRATSLEASARVLPGSADFVYLDARHDDASVREDLEHWYPAVRPGGVLAGHDYVDGTFPQGVFGVKSAVDAFCAARGLTVRRTLFDGAFPSWFALVPLTLPDPASVPERPAHAR
jgi:hypothetical protein